MKITMAFVDRCLHCGAADQACRCTGSSPSQWKAVTGLALAMHVLVSATLILTLSEVFVPGWLVLLAAVVYVVAVVPAGAHGAALSGSVTHADRVTSSVLAAGRAVSRDAGLGHLRPALGLHREVLKRGTE